MMKSDFPSRDVALSSEVLIACLDIVKKDLKHCLMCMRTEEARRLVPSKTLQSLLEHLDKQAVWALQGTPLERLLLCWVCEARAAGALRFLQTLRSAIRSQRLLAHCRRFPGDVETLDDILKGKVGSNPLRALATCCDSGLRAARRNSTMLQSATQVLTSERPNESPPTLASFAPAANQQAAKAQWGGAPAANQRAAKAPMGVSPLRNQQTVNARRGAAPAASQQAAQAQMGAASSTNQQAANAQMGVPPLRNQLAAQMQMGVAPLRNQQTVNAQMGLSPVTNQQAAQAQMGVAQAANHQEVQLRIGVSPVTNQQEAQMHTSVAPLPNRQSSRWKFWSYTAPAGEPAAPSPDLGDIASASASMLEDMLRRNQALRKPGAQSAVAAKPPQPAQEWRAVNGVTVAPPRADGAAGNCGRFGSEPAMPEPMMEIIGVKEEENAEMETYLIEDDDDFALIQDPIRVEPDPAPPPPAPGLPSPAPPVEITHYMLPDVKGQPMLAVRGDGDCFALHQVIPGNDGYMYVPTVPARIKDNQLEYLQDPPPLLLQDPLGTDVGPTIQDPAITVPPWGQAIGIPHVGTSGGVRQGTPAAFQESPVDSRARKRRRSVNQAAGFQQESEAPVARLKSGAIDWEDKIPDNLIAYCDP